ncbi:hypothetical protein [Streptomyces fagopyri]|uniref:hypothetical protein n=1 Tax=Streptomyces fagopyri TaxID=2662397 RepID=UPI0033FC0F5A
MHGSWQGCNDNMWELSDEDEQHAITMLAQLLDELAAEQEVSKRASRDQVD